MVKKITPDEEPEDNQENQNLSFIDSLGLSKASEKIGAFSKRRCYPIEPISLALAIGKIDPLTGLPGVPLGTIMECAGRNGAGKTMILEHFAKQVLLENPTNKVGLLFFESPNMIRMEGLAAQGLDMNRIYQIDRSKSEEGFELETAEQGLNLILHIAANDPTVKLIGIDSIGGMPVSRELYNEKGELIDVGKTPQMAARATILTRFINQWQTIDPNTRPILFLINHMKDQLDPAGQIGLDTMKVNRIGTNTNYPTPGGVGLHFAEDVRIKIDARKIEVKEAGKPVKHPLFGCNIQTGLEVHLEVYKNKFCGDQGSRKAIGMFDFASHSFDIVDEILSYAAYLDILGISKGTTGMYAGIVPEKKLRLAQAKKYYQENPEKLKEILKEVAKHINVLFTVIKKDKGKDANKEL